VTPSPSLTSSWSLTLAVYEQNHVQEGEEDEGEDEPIVLEDAALQQVHVRDNPLLRCVTLSKTLPLILTDFVCYPVLKSVLLSCIVCDSLS
jgi:hypothetical protein